MNINGRVKVKTLKAQFFEEFGLTIRVYDGRSFADDNATLASIRRGESIGGEFSPRKNTKVGNLEEKIQELFGLKTQIAGSDDSYLCDNDLTLAGAKEVDDAKMARKAKKETKANSKRVNEEFTVSDELNSSNGEINTVELTFRGMGGEFQFHRLNREELDELKAIYLEDMDPENFLDCLDGGQNFTDSVYPGCYGVYVDDMVLENDDTNETIEIDMEQQSIQEAYFDDEGHYPDRADYIYRTKGKVFGTIAVPLVPTELFDSSKLQFHFVEYCLDGYAEEYEKILVSVFYDGRECEIQTEDNGQDSRRIITLSIFDNNNEEERKVVLDQNGEELVVDFDY